MRRPAALGTAWGAALAVLLGAVVAPACAPLTRAAGPALVEPVVNAETIVADDGATLPLHAWLPATGPPTAVVLGIHGFNDYGNFLDAAATYLAARGIASYAYDQRGFGRAAHRGLWPGAETLTRDLRAAVRAVRRHHPDAPLVVLGESMGGAVALVALAGPDAPEVDGLILVAPAVWGRETMPWYQTAALWTLAHTLPALTASGRGLGIKPTDNMEMLRAFARDPLVIKETRIDTVYGLVNLMDAALAAAPRVDGRTLVLYGERDELIPPLAIERLLSSLPETGRGRPRVIVYPDGYHMLLRDLQAETVWADVAAWIADGLACREPNVCAIVPPRRTRSSAG